MNKELIDNELDLDSAPSWFTENQEALVWDYPESLWYEAPFPEGWIVFITKQDAIDGFAKVTEWAVPPSSLEPVGLTIGAVIRLANSAGMHDTVYLLDSSCRIIDQYSCR